MVRGLMWMANEILYLKAEKNAAITENIVLIKDIAKLTCQNEHIINKAKNLKVYQFHKNSEKRQIISILKVIEILQKEFPTITIENVGETDIVVEQVKQKGSMQKASVFKIAFVCLVCFFGTAFTIMTYHNDIGIDGVFSLVYELIMGKETSHYTILELSYSIGLALGIIVFFNHIGGRRITKDPTPIEVEMRVYEDDVNQTCIDAWNREGKSIDVR